jgi:hypothetical protein
MMKEYYKVGHVQRVMSSTTFKILKRELETVRKQIPQRRRNLAKMHKKTND